MNINFPRLHKADSDKSVVLVVDDNLANIQLLGEVLTGSGYIVRPLLKGELALKAAQENPPDLILLDITMPEMDGFEVCRRLKGNERLKDIPIIFLSAHDEAFDKVQAFKLGAVDYITKPFQVEEVQARVHAHLSLYSYQRTLKEQSKTLQHTIDRVDASDIGIVSTSNDGKITDCNRSFLDCIGYSREEAKELTFKQLIVQEDHDLARQAEEKLKENGLPQIGFECRILGKDNRVLWVSITMSLICIQNGVPTGTVNVVEDINERRVAQEELRFRYEELEHFNYLMCHDLREPLRTTLLMSQKLESQLENRLDEKDRQLLKLMQKSVEKMNRMLLGLQELAENGSKDVHFESVDLNQIVQEVVSSLNGTITQRRASVCYHSLPTVLGDATQLETLLQNLISNALKFCRDHPPIVQVQGHRCDRGWIITVQDNGIGISREKFKTIFRPFARIHAKGDFEGSGFGLAACQKILERHKSKMEVESTVGCGSVFRFLLSAP